MMSERKEALMRIIVGIVSSIVLSLWKIVVIILTVVHWMYSILTGKRSKGIAEFCNMWVTQAYRYARYMTLATNSRPFPFSELGRVLDSVDIKHKR